MRPTPTRSEKGSNRLLPPRGIHYRCTGIAKPTIFILDSAEKKASLSPPSTLFSASFLQITGGPTDRSTTGIRGIHRENGADSTLRTDRRTHRSYLRIKRPGQRAISRTRHWPECGSSGYPRGHAYHPSCDSSIEFPISRKIPSRRSSLSNAKKYQLDRPIVTATIIGSRGRERRREIRDTVGHDDRWSYIILRDTGLHL